MTAARTTKKGIQILVKRIYDKSDEQDGYRILVDRLWPRGVRKEQAQVDEWYKEIAPSTALRQWFAHDPDRWEAFRQKYTDELKQNPALDNLLNTLQGKQTVTLLYGAKDEQHNQALVLRDFLTNALKK